MLFRSSCGAETAEIIEKIFILTPYIQYLYFFFGLIGTGSVPPFDFGLHLISLLTVNFKPIKKPHSAKQQLAYNEQVGVNLHAWGINGEMQNLNIATKNIAIYFGIEIIALNNFFIFNKLCLF